MILNNHYYQISTLNSKLKSQLLITNTHTHKTKDKKVKRIRKEKEKQFICQHLFQLHSSFFHYSFSFLLNLFSFHLFDLQFQYYISILYILFIYFSSTSIMTDQTKIKLEKDHQNIISEKVDSDVKVSTDTPTKNKQ